MRQRLALRRVLLQRLSRLQAARRPFTSNHAPLASRGGCRPQLPFLSIPVASSSSSPPRGAPRARYFTTEKRRWLRHEGRMFLRYNASLWGAALCLLGIVFLLNQEALEKEHPTPHEWSLLTRMRVRGARNAARDSQDREVDWVEVLVSCREALRRLEDAGVDGAGLRDLLGDDEPLSIDGAGGAGKDVSAKSENWRRGYYEVLMLLAQASEQLDGWVKDTTRNVVFPPEVVVGPSNPHPRPIPPGAASAPREEDCEAAFEPAENHYLRILTTRGFTPRQRMDAALRYASFLDYKHLPDAAERMYQWALSLATDGDAPPQPRVDPRTYTLLAGDKPSSSPPPSENLLTVLTSIALHKARAGDVNAALPIFISVLRARRALPQAPPPGQEPSSAAAAAADDSLWQGVWALAQPPVYPPPPDDGSRPPAWRHPRELCEEAALNLYIGEILYAAGDAGAGVSGNGNGNGNGNGGGRATNREEGLAWTRDAVDLAEEQLRAIGPSGGDARARHTCRECLGTGLQNWSAMIARLAREEEEAKKAKADAAAAPARSVFGFWSGAETTTTTAAADEGRWAAEEKVVKERVRRTRELLVPAEPPAVGLASLLKA
ncbi:hypothetical protein LX32DRAFT_576341 [Colletotrichum zoysiae]|uniref:MFS maltose permease n=1 Tax=Colletotrichum zoysiae TaxID=1216348 RepID=A0AAD9LUG3_9PEZI|nr:hypothetical protein LX32DRAFT_576341 [Colletotrichum zoysiae]